MAIRVSTTRSLPTAASAARFVEWLPALTALAYVAVVVVKLPELVRALYWDSDAAGAFVVGELAHPHGHVEIPRFGWWSSLLWLLATRSLPGHAHLWEATGYVFALATVVLVGWATWRVVGRWAGMTAAAGAVVVGPKTLTSLLTVNFHTSTPFTAAILAAYLVVLSRSRSLVVAGLIGLIVGVNAASDPLLWIAGVAPFGFAAAVLGIASKRRDVAIAAVLVIAVAGPVAFTTDRVMRGLGFHVIPAGVQAANVTDLPSHLLTVGKSIALVFGANFLSEPTYPSDPLRYLVALLGVLAVGATVLAPVRIVLGRAEAPMRAFACFWAAGTVLICAAYGTTNLAAGAGPGGGLNYMLTLAPAAAVGAVLLAARSQAGRVAVAAAIATVGMVNATGIVHGDGRDPTAARYRAETLSILEYQGLTHGYAPFWDAQSLTWKSGTRVLVAPVRPCDVGRRRAVCREHFFTIDSWFRARTGRSFLIVDPAGGFAEKPPLAFGRPTKVLHPPSEPDVAIYVYSYDLARHIRS